jgi:hypothetical protein
MKSKLRQPLASSPVRTALGTLPVDQQRAMTRLMLRTMKSLTDHVRTPLRLSETAQIQILRWVTWSRRNRTTLAYTIQKSFEWGTLVAGKRARLKRHKNVLPVSIAALTSPACSEFVVEQAEVDFGMNRPGTQNLRTMMINTLTAGLQPSIEGTLLDYPSTQAFNTAYESSIRARRTALEQAEVVLSRSKPFRGNPFR